MEPMATTPPMRTMPGSHKPHGFERYGLIFIMAAATCVAVLAVPRFVAGSLFALAPSVHETLKLPDPQEARDGVPWLDRSLAWHAWGDAGAMRALATRIAGLGGEQEVLVETLARSPMRPDLWLRLGRLTRAEHPDTSLAAWRMSVFAARLFPAIMEQRLDLGLSLKDRMGASDLALLDDQFRLSYVVRPAHVAQIMALAHNAMHRDYFAQIVGGLSATDIDHMIRIHALH